MFCSSCGMAVTPGLSYCNHCGARLSEAKGDRITESSEVRPETLVGAIGTVLIFGLVAIIFLMMAMKMVFGPENMHLVISGTLLGFLLLLAVEGAYIWKFLALKKVARETGDPERLKKQTARENLARQKPTWFQNKQWASPSILLGCIRDFASDYSNDSTDPASVE